MCKVLNPKVFSLHVFHSSSFKRPSFIANRSLSTCRHDIGGCWTVRDCLVVYRNTSHVRCQCHRLGTFGVLMDSSQREVSLQSTSDTLFCFNVDLCLFYNQANSGIVLMPSYEHLNC